MTLFIYYTQWGPPYPGSKTSVPRRGGPPSPPVGINNNNYSLYFYFFAQNYFIILKKILCYQKNFLNNFYLIHLSLYITYYFKYCSFIYF